MKRSGKYYFKNEKEVMKSLGLKPVPGSGSGWVHKEDGESETLLVQLKSTDANSYRIQMLDIKKLEYHAEVSHKSPVFLIQFLQQNKIYALVDVNNLDELFHSMVKEEKPKQIIENEVHEVKRSKVKSSKKARSSFFKEQEETYAKRK